jgi:hypothetical protein
MNIGTKRTLAILGAITLAVSVAGPAVAKPKEPKPITPEQLQTLMLSPEEAAQATNVPLSGDQPAACFPQVAGTPCVVRYTRANADLASPTFIRVAVYPTADAARAALSTRPGLGAGWERAVVSESENEIVLFLDEAPDSANADVTMRIAVAGRFIITSICAQRNTLGTQAGLQACATNVANAQATKLAPYQPPAEEPKKKKKKKKKKKS